MIENLHPKVLVVGDIILDRYVYGSVSRIAPDGPNPILKQETMRLNLGGAGNVANNLSAMGAEVTLIGLIGKGDESSSLVKTLCEDIGVIFLGLSNSRNRCTTCKTRYMGYVGGNPNHGAQLLRVDEEVTDPITEQALQTLLDLVRTQLSYHDILVCSDYGKGCLTERSLTSIIALCEQLNKPIVADPKPPKKISAYHGTSIITPNRYEAEQLTGIHITDAYSARKAAEILVSTAKLESVLITLDADGVYFLDNKGKGELVPTNPKQIIDVTGAGDCVIAITALMRGCGKTIQGMARIVNTVGALAVSKRGTSVVNREEILCALNHERNKIIGRNEVEKLCSKLHAENQKIVFTNGCFDLLHSGHYSYLKWASEQGDFLVVGLNSDRSVKRQKGPARPIIKEKDRALILSALDVVDCVVIFDEDTPVNLIKKVKPDLLVKGGDYSNTDEIPGADIVKAYGGEVKLGPMVPGISTTEIINRISEP